jgi:DNA polymerase-3 subunit alpha
VKGIGGKTVETMREMAGSDPFGIYSIDTTMKKMREWVKQQKSLPRPTHRANEIPTDADMLEVVFLGVPNKRDPRDVIEDERGKTGESTEAILKRMKDPHLTKRMVVQALDETDTLVFLRWNRYNYPRFEEALWEMRLDTDYILVRGIKRKGFGTSIQVKDMWVIAPDEE